LFFSKRELRRPRYRHFRCCVRFVSVMAACNEYSLVVLGSFQVKYLTSERLQLPRGWMCCTLSFHTTNFFEVRFNYALAFERYRCGVFCEYSFAERRRSGFTEKRAHKECLNANSCLQYASTK